MCKKWQQLDIDLQKLPFLNCKIEVDLIHIKPNMGKIWIVKQFFLLSTENWIIDMNKFVSPSMKEKDKSLWRLPKLYL